ncbi:protein-L-isoaspartate(D-aspartate) O-methyltransferase [Winogradskyella alexanderae]|uniref:Protein-L-isoaspartate O-methyltransferase n=1 Tax=Winogradskyella alexanderae TaxID=2877123 RepID=A0ABS7XRT3_9FLAO|nr:protein-L-isoaspartate(D-aspartate) O-methyltransferase [Winogradskyella alexanderae]MCA0132740.1 protein-L-isoaspartate(D-aspartate) O-methyltransferase [Winogradskyella alexanderae]
MIRSGILILALLMTTTNNGQNYQERREEMVKTQLQGRDITDHETLKAMRKVKRHEFVPKKVQHLAYTDGPLPIGYAQTISQPYIVAYMTQQLKPKPHHRVLEIGTGSGYQAAVLAEIVDTVYTIEIVEPLGLRAKETLTRLGYKNVITKIGDGYKGWPEEAPFDAIIVTAGINEVPPPLFDQLAEGGKLIIPVGTRFNMKLILYTKINGKIRHKEKLAVSFVPFTRGDKF